MRVFEVIFRDGLTKIVFGETRDNVFVKMRAYGFFVVDINEVCFT